jgi:RecA/RadA recombinase
MNELDKLLNQFQKKFPKITRKDSGIIKTIRLDSPQLSYLFGGGIPIGRIHRLRGPASGGKSTMSIYMAAQIQKKLPILLERPTKETIVYVDFERTFSTNFAEQLGLDCSNNKLIHLLPDDIETACDILIELIKTDDIAAIIFDSDAAAPSRTMMSDPSGKACIAPNTLIEYFVED